MFNWVTFSKGDIYEMNISVRHSKGDWGTHASHIATEYL